MPELIYMLSGALFALRIVLFSIGVMRERRRTRRPSASGQPRVSVVIPARNEEDNIARCVRSVAASDYPHDLLEIIVVNDRSEDGTGDKLAQMEAEFSNVRVIPLTEPRTEGNLRGKPGALDAGIRQARGEIILMTDADCVVHRDWVAMMSAQFSQASVGLVASFTTIRPRSLFESMQAVEWAMNHTLALGGVGLRQPLGCFGNNLSIRREVYDALGGYGNIRFSVTEDLALLQAVFAAGYELRYVCDEAATVETKPCATFREYLSQHKRWAIGGLGLGWRAAVFVALAATLAASLATAAITGNYVIVPLILLIRLAGDAAIIYPSLQALNRKDLRISTLYSVLFLMALEMCIPLLTLNKSVRWKGQVFGK